MTGLITNYMGFGLAANRPVTPSVSSGSNATYYATDTGVYSIWANGAWQTGSIATQAANNVAITGGTIDGTTIGGTTPAAGTFTTATAATHIGGTAAGSSLTLESTSGAGTSDFIAFKTGSQVERARFDTSGNFIISATSANAKLSLGANVTNKVLALFDDLGANQYGFGIAAGELRTYGAPSSSRTFGTYVRGTDTYTALITMDSLGTIRTTGFTVAGLPAAGTVGRMAYVTDATAPTYLGTLTGGGTVKTPVFDNGTVWVSF